MMDVWLSVQNVGVSVEMFRDLIGLQVETVILCHFVGVFCRGAAENAITITRMKL